LGVPLEAQRVEAVLPEPALDAVPVDDARRSIAKARLDVIDEHVRRLDDVIVDRHGLDVITQHEEPPIVSMLALVTLA
jgi:hypothetical protein